MTASALVIRDATPDDIPFITSIYARAVLHTVATLDTNEPTIEAQTEWFRHHDERHPVMVAEMEGSVVGWASLSVWNDRGAYLYTAEASLYVSEDHRRRSIGMLLMQALIERSRHLNYHVIMARVVRTNDVSLNLMHRLGFEDVGTIREVGYKFGRWLDMCVLQLLLDNEIV